MTSRRAAWVVPLALAVGAVLVLPLDLSITRFATGGHVGKSVEKAIRLSEAFSHGFGAAVILLAVFVLDRAHRSALPRLVAGTLVGGFLANSVKGLVSRTRPRNFEAGGSILDSFSGFFSFGRLSSHQEGFPSAHAATGFALAAMLAWRYPQGRVFFFSLAAVAGAQRIFSEAHFASDVLFGAALGCLAGHACLPGGVLDRPLTRLEARLALRRTPDGARSGA